MDAGSLVDGRYRLTGLLGRGGQGQVFLGVRLADGAEVAVKVLAPAIAQESARRRFILEGNVSERVRHENLVEVLDVGQTSDGELFFVMERLTGDTLARALSKSPPMTARALCKVLRDVARGLHAAHLAGLMHRDIKPANIFVTAHDPPRVKILDFGISKLFLDGGGTTQSYIGSPRYSSPEQISSPAKVDHRADLWALGVILFEALAGVCPHQADSIPELLVTIAMDPPTPLDGLRPDLPAELLDLVQRCLRPVSRRVATAHQVETALSAVIAKPDRALDNPLPGRGRSAGVARAGHAPSANRPASGTPDTTLLMPTLELPSKRPPR
ncbi:MAG: serine/threonine-protein kinase [Polyangiaceae bacterium]